MQFSRRMFFATSLYGLLDKPEQLVVELNPEHFGAKGDGRTEDGLAISRMFDHANSISGEVKVVINFSGDYLLSGCREIQYAPIHHKSKGGSVVGLPPLLRDDLEIEASGATFKVPSERSWQRTKKGGDVNDVFFVAFQFYGNNVDFQGGEVLGNLSNRKIVRGDSLSGFGGNEFGLVFGGENWTLKNAKVTEWGTDCLLVGASGRMKSCSIGYGRRNNISIVPFFADCEVTIADCRIHDAGNWDEQDRNRPGSGIQVESGRAQFNATVNVHRNTFENNREKDVQLSKGSFRSVLGSNTFSNNVNVRPGSLGGHKINENRFLGVDSTVNIYGTASSEKIEVRLNKFDQQLGQAIKVRALRQGTKRGEKPPLTIENNTSTAE